MIHPDSARQAPMRILYVLNSLGMGGAEKLTLALGEQMEKRGHNVALLVLLPRVTEEWPTHLDRRYLNIRRSPPGFFVGFERARRFADQFQPDLIHSHSFHANIFARLLKIFALRPVVISTIHNVYEGGWLRMLAYRLTDGLSRQTVAVSDAAAERFVELKAIPAHKCRVLVNGVDTSEFAPDAGRRAVVRTTMGASSSAPPDPLIPQSPEFTASGPASECEFVWLATGRVAPAKDYPNLLRAFARVRASGLDARLWICGEPAGLHLSSLQSLAAELKLGDSIRWLGLRRDMPAMLDAADGLVSASAWEGMPLAVAEAMAMEKPVVATDVGGVRQLVGDAGILVPAQSPGALAEAMLGVMQERNEQRHALGRAARQRIASMFSIKAAADRWEALYRQWTAIRGQ